MRVDQESRCLLLNRTKQMMHRKTEESLHTYLRRHYEKVSEQRARQFAAAQEEAVELEMVFDAPPVELTGS